MMSTPPFDQIQYYAVELRLAAVGNPESCLPSSFLSDFDLRFYTPSTSGFVRTLIEGAVHRRSFCNFPILSGFLFLPVEIDFSGR